VIDVPRPASSESEVPAAGASRHRPAWSLVAGVELRRRLRNRSAVVTAFVGPLALATVFGVLLSGTSSFHVTIGIVDHDGSEISAGWVDALTDADTGGDADDPDDDPVTFVRIETEQSTSSTADPLAATRTAVDDGDVDAAIVVPAGFGAAVTSGGATGFDVVRDPGGQVSGAIAEAVARQFASGLGSRRLAAATAGTLGAAVDAEALAAFVDSVDTAIASEAPGGRSIDAASFYGVAMSIMFLFFTVSFAARSIVAERQSGVLPRMLASSASPSSIVTGKVVAVSVLGLAGFATVWGVTSIAFGAPWGAPVAVVATMVATVLAIAGVATFVCGLARTEQQADGYTAVVAFLLALLGGNFVGPGQAPAALRRLASFTPNGQAIDAFTRIAVDSAGIGDVTRQLALLLGFAAVFGSIGLVRVGRVMTP
jgi:ABC-2 type transport system permease protein